MALDTLGANQTALTRPTNPHEPNGIAHATDSTDTGNGAATKAARAATKLAWASYVADYKTALLNGDPLPAEFPDNGNIDYSND